MKINFNEYKHVYEKQNLDGSFNFYSKITGEKIKAHFGCPQKYSKFEKFKMFINEVFV